MAAVKDSSLANVEVLAFDVFGTVVDWHGSIVKEIQRLDFSIDAAEFARAWRSGYQPAMQQVRSGKTGFTKIDVLHRQILDKVLHAYSLSLEESQKHALNKIWHYLDPWPDSVEGLQRLKKSFSLCTLSNGNLSLLSDMAKHGALPWDLILSAEVFKAYKPDSKTYLGVADIFDLPPEKVMMVAAHRSDLNQARHYGLRTAYIARPAEYGEDQLKDVSDNGAHDIHASDILDLARQLTE